MCAIIKIQAKSLKRRGAVPIKRLFTAIRRKDFDLVRTLLREKPDLLTCTAKQPPKKDQGQSPLQVAIKSCQGDFTIPNYLLDLGADVNFMEAEDCGSSWRMPASQDAIQAAVMCTRWTARRPSGRDETGALIWADEPQHTREESAAAFDFLQRVFDCGADISLHDSYGTSCLGRAISAASQILPREGRCISPEWSADLTRIFDLLLEQGADLRERHPALGITYEELLGTRVPCYAIPTKRGGPAHESTPGG